ncbi:helix-turn-helix domain-containing protein [Marinivivus vitaminiproducens]|uniref:helix-turn-helix domain-containing protein n=1 Tax=Marinivivus vitaminiproducens TaxID=3035935 RepID=UPI0027AB1D19|nr:helix-turn-helix transcriptional regulator [Geminicoccaceae bacterium SCSIO 64248]
MPISWTDVSVRVNGAGRVRCAPGWNLAADWSARLVDFDLWFVWAGTGHMRLSSGATIGLRPGTCLWMRPGGTYLAQQDARNRLGVTYLHFDLLPRAAGVSGPVGELPAEVHMVADIGRFDAIMRRAVTLVRPVRPAHDPAHGALIAAHLLTSLLIEIDAPTSDRAPAAPAIRTDRSARILALAEGIVEDPTSATSVAALADSVACSPDHFTRLFREILGCSPQAFIIRAKIERVRQLLLETNMSIGEIAASLRYDSPYFLARQFKQRTGCTPSHYRRFGPAAVRQPQNG